MENSIEVSYCDGYIELTVKFHPGKKWDITIETEKEDFYFDEFDNSPKEMTLSVHESQYRKFSELADKVNSLKEICLLKDKQIELNDQIISLFKK